MGARRLTSHGAAADPPDGAGAAIALRVAGVTIALTELRNGDGETAEGPRKRPRGLGGFEVHELADNRRR